MCTYFAQFGGYRRFNIHIRWFDLENVIKVKFKVTKLKPWCNFISVPDGNHGLIFAWLQVIDTLFAHMVICPSKCFQGQIQGKKREAHIQLYIRSQW